jgi:NifB/MoaA-like Fe-S oxidoreductase
VVNDCTGWQKEFRKAHGSRLVWPSDEFYIQSGIEIPGAAAYEEFPQIENGIGLCRVFLDELKAVGRNIAAKRLRPGKYVLVTGVLAESMVRRLSDALSRVEGVTARVCVVKNKFLGESVTVAGLLCGADVIDALQDVSSDEEVLIPDIMLNEERFLDDVTLEDVKRQCRGKVTEVCASPKSVVRYLRSSATS